MDEKIALKVASALCSIIALAHLVRAFLGVEITVAGIQIPVALSWLAAVVFLALAVWMWASSRK